MKHILLAAALISPLTPMPPPSRPLPPPSMAIESTPFPVEHVHAEWFRFYYRDHHLLSFSNRGYLTEVACKAGAAKEPHERRTVIRCARWGK